MVWHENSDIQYKAFNQLLHKSHLIIMKMSTFLQCRKAIPLMIWYAKYIASPTEKACCKLPVDSFHSSEKWSRLFFRKVFKSPWGQYSRMANKLPPFVQAPNKLTMLLCLPIWMRILISDARSLYSASVASSVNNKKQWILWWSSIFTFFN